MKVLFLPGIKTLTAALALVFLSVIVSTFTFKGSKDEKQWREEMYRPGLTGKLVMIDPGHGGADPGATGGGKAEKDINLAISRYLVRELKRDKVKALLTREEKGGINPAETMSFVEQYRNLLARKAMAVEEQAHIFVSIHANSNRDRSASGGIVYYNAGNPYNRVLAQAIQNELNGLYKLNRTVEQADFTVVTGNQMPAVLVEAGFITNPGDRKRLTDKGFQQDLARAVCRGLVKYAAGLKGGSN